MPEHNKERSTNAQTHTQGGKEAEDVNAGARGIALPEQIGSDASACACQEHAESMLGRRRGGGGAGDRLCARTRCDRPAGVCQVQVCIYPGKKGGTRADAGRRSPSVRDANERDRDFFSTRVCLREKPHPPRHVYHGGQKLNGVSKFQASAV